MWGPCVWVSNDSAHYLASCRCMLRILHSYPPLLGTTSRFTAISMFLSRNGVFQVCRYRNLSRTGTRLDWTGLSWTGLDYRGRASSSNRRYDEAPGQHACGGASIPLPHFQGFRWKSQPLRNTSYKLYWARSAGGGRGEGANVRRRMNDLAGFLTSTIPTAAM
jgi:hypothetical protein